MTKFDRSRKLDYLVCHFGTSSFGNFRAKLRKELKLKI
jgi:hypothetical protein